MEMTETGASAVAEPPAEALDPTEPTELAPKVPRRRARSQKLDQQAREPAPPAEFKEVARAGDRALADIIAGLGTQGRYKIKLYREMPNEVTDPATGERIVVAGYLRDYTQPIDEEAIQRNHGGGRYVLKFYRQAPNGSFTFAQPSQMTVDVGGDPRLDDVPRTRKPASPPTVAMTTTDNPSVIMKAMDVLANQATRAPEPKGPDPMVDLLRQQLDAQNTELRELRAAIATRDRPPEDTFKDKWLEKLADADSARVKSVSTQYESEIRMLKEHAIQNENRLRDLATADRAEMRAAHQREIDLIRQSHDATLASVKLSGEVTKQMLEAENRRLESALKDAKDELRALREKKDKPLLEQVKDIEALRESLGGDGDASTVDKVIGALPEVLPMVGNWFSREKPKEEPKRDRIVKAADGQKFIQKPNGDLIPVKKNKPAPAATPAQAQEGEQAATPKAPEIDQAQLKQVVDYLGRSFDNNADPQIVAQSARVNVPEWLMQLLRTNSVDDVFYKMAQLPTGHTLTTQRGRQWLRKVGAALVGG